MCVYFSILGSVQEMLQQATWQMKVINKSHYKGLVNPNMICTIYLCQVLGHPTPKFSKLNVSGKIRHKREL